MCEGDVRPGGAVGLSLDPLMNGHDSPRPTLGRSESEITPDMRLPPEDEGALWSFIFINLLLLSQCIFLTIGNINVIIYAFLYMIR